MTNMQIENVLTEIKNNDKKRIKFLISDPSIIQEDIDVLELNVIAFVFLRRRNVKDIKDILSLFEKSSNAFHLSGIPSEVSYYLLTTLFSYFDEHVGISGSYINNCFY